VCVLVRLSPVSVSHKLSSLCKKNVHAVVNGGSIICDE